MIIEFEELVGEEHEECKKQKQLVEEEFERYKLRAQSILKNKNKVLKLFSLY